VLSRAEQAALVIGRLPRPVTHQLSETRRTSAVGSHGPQAIVTVLLAAMIREMRRNDLFRPGAPQDAVAADLRDSVIAASVFVISIPLALVAGQWAYLAWFATPLILRMAGRRKP